jgi:DNA helicase-2/ATP-dependent DNA helicase PcrA
MNTSYKDAYTKLNKEQREAVDTIDGPLLVIAGPGTGKTQLLSTRVANILQKTDTDPNNILCLTFTNFAAINMQDRLLSLIGPSAHKVMVRTFHSFAAEIMNIFPDYFWSGAELQIVPDPIQIETIQNILSSLPLDNPLASRFAGAFTALGDVQQALRLTKEAGLTPQKLKAMIEVNSKYIDVIEPLIVDILGPTLSIKKLPDIQKRIQELPEQPIDQSVTPLVSLSGVIKDSLDLAIQKDIDSGKTLSTGAWKRQWIQSNNGEKAMFNERKRNDWWLALVDVYTQYRNQLHEKGFYDYSDMIVEVITQMEQHSDLLSEVQEKYQYILIDEFQDTNAAQLRLSHLVANHPIYEGNPNIMAVGDDDQSIFAFNGAELNNMIRFQKTYTQTKTIVLSKNYRSTQSILDTANSIISLADDRLVYRESVLEKKLFAESRVAEGKILHMQFPTKEHQMKVIADTIAATWNENPNESIAVLARNHDSLRSLSAYLHSKKIPIRYEQQNNVLDLPLIKQIILVTEILGGLISNDKPLVNMSLSMLLRYEEWGINPIDLWNFALNSSKDKDWIKDLAESKNNQANKIADWLLWLSNLASKEPLGVVLEYVIGLRDGPKFTSPLHDAYISSDSIDSNYLDGLSGLRVLLQTVSEIAKTQNRIPTIADFQQYISISLQQKKPLTDESWFVSGEKAVQLLTIYKAKGLEFDTVFMVDAIDTNWQPKRRGRKPPANLPLQPYGELYDDYVRLAYVAVTRARKSYIVSSYAYDGNGRELLATPLIESLPILKSEPENLPNSLEVLESSLTWPRLSTRDEKSLLQARLNEYHLSATGFLQYLDIPHGGPAHFLERQLLRLPQVTTVSMAFGTALHASLQTAQLLTNKDKFSINTVLDSFKHSLSLQNLSNVEKKRFEKLGVDTIERLFKDLDFKLPKNAFPEYVINQSRLGTVRLRGNLDHVQVRNDSVLISDYKTGTPLTSFETKDATKSLKAWRHKNQLLFYYYLYKQSTHYKKRSTISTQMIYLEAEQPNQLILSLEDTKEELQRAEALINIVWKNIMSGNFPDTEKYPKTIAGIHAFENDLLKNYPG